MKIKFKTLSIKKRHQNDSEKKGKKKPSFEGKISILFILAGNFSFKAVFPKLLYTPHARRIKERPLH